MGSTPSGKTNKRAVLLLVGAALLILVVCLALWWRFATPFDTLAADSFPQVGGKSRGSEIMPETGAPADQSVANVLVISVEPVIEGTPRATYRLPASGMWALPRFFFEQNPEDKSWSLVFIPPAGKAVYEPQIRALPSPWRQVLENQTESAAGVSDATHGSRHAVLIPSGKIQLLSGIDLKKDKYDERKTKELASSAAVLADLAKDQVAKKELLSVLRSQIPGTAKTFEDLTGSSSTDWTGALTHLAASGHLYLCQKTNANNGANKLLSTFYFDASPLDWVGSLGFSRARSLSPRVEVRLAKDAAEYKFESTYLNTADDPKKELSRIAEFQAKTADSFTKQRPATTWPGDAWLYGDPLSLNAMSFIGVLQSLSAVYSANQQTSTNSLLVDLAKGTTEERIKQMGDQLNEIAKDSRRQYHNTYLYCEYLVALVHLQKLANNVPGDKREGYNRIALTTLILAAAERLANNVTSDGKFRRYLNSPSPDWDRSVGQVALYALQYVQLHLADEDVSQDKLLKDKLTKICDALNRLAGDLGQFRNGVPYQGSGANLPLVAAHFQAAIAKLQLKSSEQQSGITSPIRVEEFANDLKKIEEIFSTSFPLVPDQVFRAYQLMYWARVYELLESLRVQSLTRRPELQPYFPASAEKAISSLRGQLASKLSVFALEEIMSSWVPDSKLSIASIDPPFQARDIMLVIALESLRTAYKLIPNSTQPPPGR